MNVVWGQHRSHVKSAEFRCVYRIETPVGVMIVVKSSHSTNWATKVCSVGNLTLNLVNHRQPSPVGLNGLEATVMDRVLHKTAYQSRHEDGLDIRPKSVDAPPRGRVTLLCKRFEHGCDLFSGEPLSDEQDIDDWCRLQDNMAEESQRNIDSRTEQLVSLMRFVEEYHGN